MPFETIRGATPEEIIIARGGKPHPHQEEIDQIKKLLSGGENIVVLPTSNETYDAVEKRRTSLQGGFRKDNIKIYSKILPRRQKRYSEPSNYNIYFSTEPFSTKSSKTT